MDGSDPSAPPPAFFPPHLFSSLLHHAAVAAASPPSSSAPSSFPSAAARLFSAAPPSSAPEGGPVLFSPPVGGGRSSPPLAAPSGAVKRKRGRPRKYGVAPSPSPAPAPSVKKPSSSSSLLTLKSASPQKKDSSASSGKKAQLAGLGITGQRFTPHLLTIADGEDVAQKIISFGQQSKRVFCVLAASGSIASASLRQPAAYGGYVTYEGRYDITSLSGSFLSVDSGETMRTGGLSICLSGPDGRLVGGGVGGPLLAAGTVQVIAGSFVVDIQDLGGAKTTEGSASKDSMPMQDGSAFTSPVAFRATTEPSGRIATGRVTDDYQGASGTNFLMQSRGLQIMGPFSSPDWRGREVRTGDRASQSIDDEDGDNFQE